MHPENKTVVKDLSKALAGTFLLALKTHCYHWNITGNNFYSMHLLLEKQYEDLYEGADILAERIRALGHMSPGTFPEFRQLSSIQDAKKDLDYKQIIKDLAKDHATLTDVMKELIRNNPEDDSTIDLVTARITFHDQAKWMLLSSL